MGRNGEKNDALLCVVEVPSYLAFPCASYRLGSPILPKVNGTVNLGDVGMLGAYASLQPRKSSYV